MNRIVSPNHDNCTLITDRTGTQPLVSEYKLCATWDYLKIFVSLRSKQDVINSEQISLLLTLYNFPSLPAAAAVTKNDDVFLAVHHNRCMMIPLFAEKKDVILS